jgi:hypothetical protein
VAAVTQKILMKIRVTRAEVVVVVVVKEKEKEAVNKP